jgi:hypothetical protein
MSLIHILSVCELWYTGTNLVPVKRGHRCMALIPSVAYCLISGLVLSFCIWDFIWCCTWSRFWCCLCNCGCAGFTPLVLLVVAVLTLTVWFACWFDCASEWGDFLLLCWVVFWCGLAKWVLVVPLVHWYHWYQWSRGLTGSLVYSGFWVFAGNATFIPGCCKSDTIWEPYCLCFAGIFADLLPVLCFVLVVVGSVVCLLDWIDFSVWSIAGSGVLLAGFN